MSKETDHRIPVILVTGYLGAGKTTFLKKVLDQYGDDHRLGIIQNEFAPKNVDGPELEQTGKSFELLEINNGSVFCICLLPDFLNGLKNFASRYAPELIMIESSGLSDPLAVTEIFRKEDIKTLVNLREVWTIVDTRNFQRTHKMLNRVQHQVMIADHLILNKTDLASPDDLSGTRDEVRYLNPAAHVHETSFCSLDIPDLLHLKPPAHPPGKKEASLPLPGRPEMTTGVFRSGRTISSDHLKKLLKVHASGLTRVKGHVRLSNGKTLIVQQVFDDLNLIISDRQMGNTALVFIGERFNLSGLSREFRALAD